MLLFQPKKILVVGDIMLDQYWNGKSTRISPEAPVPIIDVKKLEYKPGGAANVALNLASLGAQVTLQGIVGADDAAKMLKSLLIDAGIQVEFCQQPACQTITKLRILSQNQQLVRIDQEQGFKDTCAGALSETLERFTEKLSEVDAVILSDYDKGTLEKISKFITLARKSAIPVFVDPKKSQFKAYRGANMIKPNMKEFVQAVGHCRTLEEIVEKGSQLLKNCEIDTLLITRGEAGASLITKDAEVYHVPTQAKSVFDVSGAGDTVIGAFAISLLSDYSLQRCVEIANAAASVVVSKVGTATASIEELNAALGFLDHKQKQGIVSELELVELLDYFRSYGEKIVFTNGVFDILHAGHVKYLEQAKKLGDKLVVAVNVDETVQKLKGPDRPINVLQARMKLLASLRCVDWVLPFSEMTPERLIEKINPDIMVKGGDYTDIEALPGAKYVLSQGGSVRILGIEKGYSTTNTIEKIRDDNLII